MGVVTWHARALDKTDFETFPFCKWLPFLSFSVFIFQIFHQQHLPPPEFSDYLSSQISVIFIWFENFVRGFWIRKGAGGEGRKRKRRRVGPQGSQNWKSQSMESKRFSLSFSQRAKCSVLIRIYFGQTCLWVLCVSVCVCVCYRSQEQCIVWCYYLLLLPSFDWLTIQY